MATSTIRLFVAFCTVIMMTGCESKRDKILDQEAARAIFSQYLDNPKYDAKVTALFENEEKLKVDALGSYRGKSIAVRYGRDFRYEAPRVSPDIDFLLDIPLGDQALVVSAMESLKSARYTPILARTKNLGTIGTYEPIRGFFTVRNAQIGRCFVYDETRAMLGKLPLVHKGGDVFALKENAGFELGNGEHEVSCNFSNRGLTTNDLVVATFVTPKDNTPKYLGGLKDTRCALSKTKKLIARFTTYPGPPKVVYWVDRVPQKSNVFRCDAIGVYAVRAVATYTNGLEVKSPLFTIEVTFKPEMFWEKE